MTPSVLLWLPVALAVAALMEPWAALLHGRVWHRSLWSVHVSHHLPRRGALEANDAFSLLHAPVAVALILYGCVSDPGAARELAFGVGIGMTMFGVAYFVVHDGLVHGRLPVEKLARIRYFERVREAHRVHHRGGRGGVPYGLFLGPWELRSRRARELARDPGAPAGRR